MREQKRRGNGPHAERSCSQVCSSWASVYQEYYEEIASYLIRHVRCPDDAEDLLQEVFLCLVSRRHLPENARAYVYTVARRCLGAYWRKHDLRMTAERTLSARSQVTNAVDSALDLDPVELLYAQEQSRGIVQAMNQLPPLLAETLRLRVVHALPVVEAARQARCSSAAIKKRLTRAKRRLRHLCGDIG